MSNLNRGSANRASFDSLRRRARRDAFAGQFNEVFHPRLNFFRRRLRTGYFRFHFYLCRLVFSKAGIRFQSAWTTGWSCDPRGVVIVTIIVRHRSLGGVNQQPELGDRLPLSGNPSAGDHYELGGSCGFARLSLWASVR
jgi:hypothetical protein